MRLDRALTLYFARLLYGLSRRASGCGVPILMYHSISSAAEHGVTPYYRTVTTPEVFALQMRLLAESGYEVLTLSQALARLSASRRVEDGTHTGKPLNTSFKRAPVVVTFDDGFRDFYTTAFPIMERHGFKATVFLSTAFIGGRFLTGGECLGIREIQELSAQGIEFGSHTVNHPQLRDLARSEVLAELVVSKGEIENIVSQEVTSFSYPFQFPEEDRVFVRELGDLMTAAGYRSGVTTAIGTASRDDDPRFLKRLPVNGCDDAALLRAKLSGEYDWMHSVQLTSKHLRALGGKRTHGRVGRIIRGR